MCNSQWRVIIKPSTDFIKNIFVYYVPFQYTFRTIIT